MKRFIFGLIIALTSNVMLTSMSHEEELKAFNQLLSNKNYASLQYFIKHIGDKKMSYCDKNKLIGGCNQSLVAELAKVRRCVANDKKDKSVLRFVLGVYIIGSAIYCAKALNRVNTILFNINLNTFLLSKDGIDFVGLKLKKNLSSVQSFTVSGFLSSGLALIHYLWVMFYKQDHTAKDEVELESLSDLLTSVENQLYNWRLEA